MNTPPRTRLKQRLLALILACLFVVQAAATAANGCWQATWGGGCCCALESAEARTELGAPDLEPSSCCSTRVEAQASTAASTETPASDRHTPSVEEDRSCGCRLAPLPEAPAQSVSTESRLDAAGPRGDFGVWIARAASDEFESSAPQALASAAPPTGPPRPWSVSSSCSFSARRLASRGVIGLLSDLCTLRN